MIEHKKNGHKAAKIPSPIKYHNTLMERAQAIKTASEARFKRYAPCDVKIWLQNCSYPPLM